ncbi:hypothetical protein PghCCS26_41130 [Paenibacillus glycanilyticus]|uniref:Uncharacterized protein n=1 Tax=Paenibacillus glycanilyticus TaxID=126569 RepID=A0ABQ6NR16_9BACL|nr:hypothetical protein PghCCS26_41130 [Paenibacillus glycanilyticus]
MNLARQQRLIGTAETNRMGDAADTYPPGRHNEVPLPAEMDNLAMHAEIRIGID